MTPRQHLQPVRAVHLGGVPAPHNDEAEMAVLAALFVDRRALRDVRRSRPGKRDLRATDFYSDANRRIYEVMLELDDAGTPIDAETVANALKTRERLHSIGGVSYIAKVIGASPAIAHVDAHAAIVIEKAAIRAVDEACALIRGRAYGDYGDAKDFFADARRQLAEAVESHVGKDGRCQTAREAGAAVDAHLKEVWAGKREPWGLPLPWARVNLVLHGLSRGHVVFVAAREGEGKSLWLNQVVIHLAGRRHNGRTQGAFLWNGEMPNEQSVKRAYVHIASLDMTGPPYDDGSNVTRVTMNEVCTGREGGVLKDDLGNPTPMLSANKTARIDAASTTWANKPIILDDTPGIDLSSLRLRVREAREQFAERDIELGVVGLDHFHLMTHVQSKSGNSAEAMRDTANGLKSLAKDENVCVVSLAQYTQEAGRTDDTPINGDIIGAAAIKQIADAIIHIRRPWERHADKRSADADKVKHDAEMHVTKNRDGKNAILPLQFYGERLKFEESD